MGQLPFAAGTDPESDGDDGRGEAQGAVQAAGRLDVELQRGDALLERLKTGGGH
ncbi:MAG: hypothetical protein GQE15_35420 [Archangiaceae bacterium]|nr:hypothetical protein [Archangiaceae bacterium]